MKKFLVGALAALLCLAPIAAAAQVTAPVPVKLPALLAVAQTVRTGGGVLQWAACYNPNAAVAYVQVFDSAAPTVGTTAAALALPVPATSNIVFPVASQYFNGVTVAATTTPGGSTALGTALVCNFGVN